MLLHMNQGNDQRLNDTFNPSPTHNHNGNEHKVSQKQNTISTAQPPVTGAPFLTGTSFDFLAEEADLGDPNAANLLSMPFLSSLRSYRGVTSSVNMKDEDLSFQFEDNCSVANGQLFGLSRRSVEFNFNPLQNGMINGNSNQQHVQQGPSIELNIQNNHNFGNEIQNNQQQNGLENQMHQSHILNHNHQLGEEEDSGKRKANMFTSRRNYSLMPSGSSVRPQARSFIHRMVKPFSSVANKKTRSDSSDNETTGTGTQEGGKHYSKMENTVLVGEIYLELFKNPALKKQTWAIIAERFDAFFRKYPQHKPSCVRTKGALERHFKVLKEQNRKEGGTMFMDLYEDYRKTTREYEGNQQEGVHSQGMLNR